MRHLLLFAGLAVGAIGGAGLTSKPVWAQVTSDGTLNTTVSTIGNDARIIDGTAVGGNLFHSFGQFSIPTGGSAAFDLVNTPNVSTIFSRVTGGTVSNIDGVIQTTNSNNPVSLFLINPAGILLGPNASLNIGGSFIGTTASSIKFANGSEFASTATPLPGPLLTVSVPIGLQMGNNLGTIVNQAFNFVANPKSTLALVGGDLRLQDSYLNAPDGHIELGSIGSNSFVSLLPNASGWRFGYSGVTAFQNILADNSFVDASGNGGGTIQLRGGAIQLLNGSQAYVITTGPVSGGGIVVQAQDSLSVVGLNPISGFSSEILTIVSPDATGDAGSITVQAPSLKVADGGLIASLGLGSGKVGNIAIQSNQVNVLASSANDQAGSIVTFVASGAQGNGGDITLDTQQLSLLNGGQISASTEGIGNAGNLTVRAQTIMGIAQADTPTQTGLFSSVLPDSIGRGGSITIATQQLSLQGGAAVISGTAGAGNAGDIAVQAATIVADNTGSSPDYVSGLLATSFPGATGNAGNLSVNTQTLSLLNGAKLSSSVAGTGNGGDITVRANTIDAIGNLDTQTSVSLISAAVAPEGTGNAGNISIATDRLNLNGAQIVSATLGNGNAGNITISATDVVATGASQDGAIPAGIFAAVGPGARGEAGSLIISTDRLRLNQGAEISTATLGLGNAGQVTIRASDFASIDGIGPLGNAVSNISSTVAEQAVGEGGSLTIQAKQLRVTNGGQISASTLGQGNAGNISAQADTLLVQGGAQDGTLRSNISATSTSNFAAGWINLRADQLRVDQGAFVSVNSSATGSAGDLVLTANDLQVANGGSLQAQVRDGRSGQIAILTNSLALTNGKISTSTLGSGRGGQIKVEANTIALTDNSRIESDTSGAGNAGSIAVTAQTTMLQTSSLSSQSTSNGNGGLISLDTRDLLLTANSSISTASNGSGNAGNLSFEAQQTSLQNGSQITSRSTGSGNGGSLSLIGETLQLRKGASINSSTASGNGGNLNLSFSGLLDLRTLSQLTAEAKGNGNGGNITIAAQFVLGFGNSDIIANAFQGNGGNIQITTQGILGLQLRPQLTPKNDITASSQFGVNGTVQIQVLSIDPSNGLMGLPVSMAVPSRQIAAGCTRTDDSSFVVTGRGGIPDNPTQPLRSDRAWADTRNLSPFLTPSSVSQPANTPTVLAPTPIVEASSLRYINGQLELVVTNSLVPTIKAAPCARAIDIL
jgi:filamentous hemagglutinin family protein